MQAALIHEDQSCGQVNVEERRYRKRSHQLKKIVQGPVEIEAFKGQPDYEEIYRQAIFVRSKNEIAGYGKQETEIARRNPDDDCD